MIIIPPQTMDQFSFLTTILHLSSQQLIGRIGSTKELLIKSNSDFTGINKANEAGQQEAVSILHFYGFTTSSTGCGIRFVFSSNR